jgi:molybdate/tungstate transport system substrate-binding protein
VSETLKLSRGTGVRILAVLLICGFALAGTAYYYGLYAPQQQQSTQSMLALIGIPYGGGTVNVLCAGSLGGDLKTAAAEFEALYPGVTVNVVAHGSLEDVALLKAGTPCDLIFVADYNVMKNDLYQVPVPQYSNLINYTNWWADFASNNICIIYNPTDLPGLNSTNWYSTLYTDLITSLGSHWGRANPDLDPCGYQTMIALNISDTYYPANSGEYPGYPSGGLELLVNSSTNGMVIGADEADVTNEVGTGALWACFSYPSLAIQHSPQLSYISLPQNVSLGNTSSAYNAWYSQFSYTDAAATYWGSTIRYAVTVPNTASIADTYWAEMFLAFVLSSPGQTIISNGGQPVFNPAVVEGSWSQVPSLIQSVTVPI